MGLPNSHQQKMHGVIMGSPDPPNPNHSRGTDVMGFVPADGDCNSLTHGGVLREGG